MFPAKRTALKENSSTKVSPAKIEAAVIAVEAGERKGLLANILAFCRVLRDLGMDVTAGRILDICRSIDHIDICKKGEFYYSLRANLISSQEDMEVFDQAFALFWRLPEVEEAWEECCPTGFDQNTGADGEPMEEIQQQVFIEDWAKGESQEDDEKLSMATYSPAEIMAAKDFSAFRDDEVPLIREMVSKIASKIAIRMSRRKRTENKGREVDFRRTLRKNLKYGGDIIELSRRKRRIKKTRIITLCDISGSMDAYSRFLVQFMYSIQNELTNVETFVFSTSLNRITHLLKRRTLDESLAEVSKKILHWSGGTNIGLCLNQFNEGEGKGMFTGKAIAIVVSDGWDRGDTQMLEAEMKKLRRRAFRIIWLNPLLGSSNYQPLCEGIKTALPYVDYFLPLYNLESLATLGETLTVLTR
ncbi:MAG: VWA domain-containing protein [Chloroflexi bacterium]|nr:VWA domain-containing protein [Chloroflexota bacterium]